MRFISVPKTHENRGKNRNILCSVICSPRRNRRRRMFHENLLQFNRRSEAPRPPHLRLRHRHRRPPPRLHLHHRHLSLVYPFSNKSFINLHRSQPINAAKAMSWLIETNVNDVNRWWKAISFEKELDVLIKIVFTCISLHSRIVITVYFVLFILFFSQTVGDMFEYACVNMYRNTYWLGKDKTSVKVKNKSKRRVFCCTIKRRRERERERLRLVIPSLTFIWSCRNLTSAPIILFTFICWFDRNKAWREEKRFSPL